MEESKKLLRSKEAAKYLGVSHGMLRISRHTGELFKGVPGPKFLKLGKAVRYPRENLDEWIRSHHQFRNNAEVGLVAS
jgi:excisionase family DNA binding protein